MRVISEHLSTLVCKYRIARPGYIHRENNTLLLVSLLGFKQYCPAEVRLSLSTEQLPE